MSGLETAIRNALDRSDRADGQIRSRIYQSARQALETGLRKQGVSDMLIVMQQQKRLEDKIREIEEEEIARLKAAEEERFVEDEPDDMELSEDAADLGSIAGDEQPRTAPTTREFELQGEARPSSSRMATAPAVSEPEDDGHMEFSADRPVSARSPEPIDVAPVQGRGKGAPKVSRRDARKAAKQARGQSVTGLDVPPERAAKPRRRRGFLSHLVTWMLTLAIVAGGCWWFYQSGMVQSVIEDALQAAGKGGQSRPGEGGGSFDPRRAFSDEWVEIFKPGDPSTLKAGAQATAEATSGSEGAAARIISAVPGEAGDVAIEVPADLLKQMAGKTSTVALTLQAGINGGVQLSVRCDFGSLGGCARHRFTATQEKLEALFQVTFERSLAPNRPGRLLINTAIDGTDKPVFLYAARILPGQ